MKFFKRKKKKDKECSLFYSNGKYFGTVYVVERPEKIIIKSGNVDWDLFEQITKTRIPGDLMFIQDKEYRKVYRQVGA